MISASAAASRPLQSLTALFLAWKSFLLVVAAGSALTSDYDTSTSLFFQRIYGSSSHGAVNTTAPFLAGRLTRWDAIYFVHAAHEGYVYEQEWAFGTGLPATVGLIQRGLAVVGIEAVSQEALIAIAIAHVSHLVAVMALYKLTMLVAKDQKLAFLAATLHIMSPAGLFMSAPYGESPCSCLSFLGDLLFAHSLLDGRANTFRASVLKVAAGTAIGLAVAFRSNALLGGLLFAVDAVNGLYKLVNGPSLSKLCLLGATVAGGLCVAAGLIIPQAIAWRQYCYDVAPGVEMRPWCSRMIPSIYTFVQEFYWDVGLFRYWTLDQLPLFLLATPVLSILLISGTQTLQNPSLSAKSAASATHNPQRELVRTLAATQTILAVLAITYYHVQIITRISTAYPVWYWWVAGCLLDRSKQKQGVAIVMFMVMYAGIQGGLFASFLPPA